MTHSVYRFGENCRSAELRSEDVRDFADLQIRRCKGFGRSEKSLGFGRSGFLQM